MDQLDQIIAYEQGDLDEQGTIDLFQSLVNSGLAWQLQGHYGRTAHALISRGLIKLPNREVNWHETAQEKKHG